MEYAVVAGTEGVRTEATRATPKSIKRGVLKGATASAVRKALWVVIRTSTSRSYRHPLWIAYPRAIASLAQRVRMATTKRENHLAIEVKPRPLLQGSSSTLPPGRSASR